MGKKVKNETKSEFEEKLNNDRITNTTSKFKKDTISSLYKTWTKSGFEELDNLLGGGFTPGWVVLGAVSNLGKSTFALQIAKNIAENGTPVIYFSLEMPKDLLAAKLISQYTFQNSGKDINKAVMAKSLLNKEDVEAPEFKDKWPEIEVAEKKLSSVLNNLYIVDAKDDIYLDSNQSFTAENIRSYVRRFIDKQEEEVSREDKEIQTIGDGSRKPFVIIDYLQIIPPDEKMKTNSQMQIIDANIDILSKIDKDITVMIISSIGRASYDKPLSMEAFKGSGSIEYSSDVLLGLQFRAVGSSDFDLNEEKMKFPRQVEVVALKQRYYASGDAKVMFDYYSAYDYFEVYKSKNSEEEKSTRSKSDNKKKSSESQRDNNKKNASRTTFTPNQSTWFNECSSIAKLKQTYKKLSKTYHPDISETGNEKIFKEISEEYKKLEKYFEDIKGKTNE